MSTYIKHNINCMCWWFRRPRQRVHRVEDLANRLASSMRTDEKGHKSRKRVSFKDDDLFINQCKAADTPPESMISYLQARLTGELPQKDRENLTKLLNQLREQLRAERIRIIAEDYQFRSQSFECLEANCAIWGVRKSDIVAYFDPENNAGDVALLLRLRDAIRNGQDWPPIYM
jgi:hypothetical protein